MAESKKITLNKSYEGWTRLYSLNISILRHTVQINNTKTTKKIYKKNEIQDFAILFFGGVMNKSNSWGAQQGVPFSFFFHSPVSLWFLVVQQNLLLEGSNVSPLVAHLSIKTNNKN